MNTKGIFLTIDGLFAIVLTFVFLGFIFANMTFSSQDSLTTEAMSESLQYALMSGHKADVWSTLDESSYELFLDETLVFCGDVSVFESSDLDTPILTATKGGCTSTAYPIVGRRSFYVENTIHVAYMEVWYE